MAGMTDVRAENVPVLIVRMVVLCGFLLGWCASVSADTPLQAAGDEVVFRQSAELPEHPLRIVSLEAITTEMLLALDIVPAGAAGLDAYQRQNKPRSEQLDNSVALGTEQQPNLERLIRLKPDLVIGTSSLHGSLFDRLDRLAPTVLYDVSLTPVEGDAIDQIAAVLRHLGVLTHRQPQAGQVLASLDAALADSWQVAADAGITGLPLAVLYPLPAQGVFTVPHENTLVGSLASRLGGNNPWPLTNPRIVHQRVEFHELAQHPDLHLLLIGSSQGAPMFDSRLWQALPVARQQRWGFLPTHYWSFGGPLTAEMILGQMQDVIQQMGQPSTADD